MIDGQLAPVGGHRAAAVEHCPHRARFVRAAVRSFDVLGLRREQCSRRVLGSKRLERCPLDPEQLLDRQLGLLVAALAVVIVEQLAVLVEQVASRPAEVPVQVPDLVLDVDHDRVGHSEP